ncbi:ABC-type nickel/cobalt efflux system permease component RcnA [Spinactinospora alkalitolerans]|uniref:ABC-type nickel/cobalt efflux system permease component RcnA n=1 Tax=Spinactinospora alkalitolerans TaxID=687207 RepID=A0A852TQT8_9ACTN|nr:DUF2530 domain-containing protein [Spinactinospora alkalitolerans]NYE45182.1 ABC-type nickel/cobalt efflux system permease component RcnA [Spinactinospora alkalitolerans]
MRKPRQPDPEVLESDYRVPTALGAAAWAVALVVLLAMGDRLAESDRWWIWVCVTGIVLGVFAFFYIPRLLRKRSDAEDRHAAKRAAAAEEQEDQEERPPGEQPADESA